MARPPLSPEPITFDEPHFTFAVMETEPVTHMVGIIMTETHRLRWFDIVGKKSPHTHKGPILTTMVQSYLISLTVLYCLFFFKWDLHL